MKKGSCVHCGRVGQLCRKLCWSCYVKPEIAERYPKPPRKTKPKQKQVCVNCKRTLIIQARNLCGTCHKRPDVRALHTPVKDCLSGSPIVKGDSSILPAEPTQAQPGSEEKIRILAERAAAGIALHHPDDRRCKAFRGSDPDWECTEQLIQEIGEDDGRKKRQRKKPASGTEDTTDADAEEPRAA